MLSNEILKERLEQIKDVTHVEVEGDGYHYTVSIVSNEFEGKTRVARQQWVYRLVDDLIANGSLHAITLNTYTEHEWEKSHG